MLTVVRPPSAGQGSGAPKGRHPRKSPALSLTDVEAMRLRAALRNLRALYGTWIKLAEAMGGIAPNTIANVARGRTPGSPALVLRAARAANLPVERILSAGPVDTAKCPHCGRGGT